MLQVFQMFKGILQVFHMDVVKVDRNVAYVIMAIHVCCQRLFQMLHLFFQTYVVSVFICMLHMFHTYVANVLFGCRVCFAMVMLSVFMYFYKCFSFFERMLQMLQN